MNNTESAVEKCKKNSNDVFKTKISKPKSLCYKVA